MNIGKHPGKKQLGGFGVVPPGLLDLFSGDSGPVSFDKILELGSKLGGASFDQAVAADDPSIYMNNILGQAGQAHANNLNPLKTTEEIQMQAEEAAKKDTFLGIGKRRTQRRYEEQLTKDNNYQAQANQVTGAASTVQTAADFGQMSQLLEMFNMFTGAKGGFPMMQQGGAPAGDKPPSYEEVLAYALETENELLNLKQDGKGQQTLEAILQDMGYGGDYGAGAIQDYKLQHKINVSPKTGADNKFDKTILSRIAEDYKKQQLEAWGYDPNATKKMQDGGKALLGYSDNSPYAQDPSITILGNNITMDQTGRPIMAYPNVGAPKLMPPYSGNHVFPGANQVVEVPVGKKGGKKGPRKVPYFQLGSGPEGQPAAPIAVQLEDAEVFATNELEIIDTAARKKHKQMEKDLITDILRPTDYVFSDDPTMTFKKKEAEDISFGMGGMHYEEGVKSDLPEEDNAAKLFKKNEEEIRPAEYVRRVRDEYPTSKQEDVFSQKTNEYNKASRIPFLAVASMFNERGRTRGKGPVRGYTTNFENRFENGIGAEANIDNTDQAYAPGVASVPQMQKGGVPKGQLGLDVVGAIAGPAFDFLTGLINIPIKAAQGRQARKALAADRPQINKVAGVNQRFSGLSTAASIGSRVAQNPYVKAPQFDSTQLDASIREVPKNLFDHAFGTIAAGNRPYMDSLFQNTPNFAEAVNAYSPVAAAQIGAGAKMGADQVEKNIALENAYRDKKQAFGESQELANVTAENATTQNSNQIIGAVGQDLAGGISAQGNIEADRLNALRQNSMASAQTRIDASSALMGSISNAGNAAGNLVSSYAYAQPIGARSPGGVTNNNVPFQLPEVPQGAYSLPNQIPEGYALVSDGKGGYKYVQIHQ